MKGDGIFSAAETWKCRACRRWQPPGTQFCIYQAHPDGAWIGCKACSGMYWEMVSPQAHCAGRPNVLTCQADEPPHPKPADSGADAPDPD